jgi:hypothetical protein
LNKQLFTLCGFEPNQKMDLLYRGSLHGFKGHNFHSKCDNIPKTLTIIQSTSGNIFGGYTEATWDSVQYIQSKLDKSAFLFSLINKENSPVKVNIANGKESFAIVCNKSYGPIFGCGTGCDLVIFRESDSNSNYSSFGHNYILPNYPPYSEKALGFLAGSYNFTVKEIEVFQLK